MRPLRYVGRHRNAGYGYSLWLRLRRDIAYQLGASAEWRPGVRCTLGYLIDFDRGRFARELRELDGDGGAGSPR